ncbi:MAG: PDDEXK nuclease domain-containing protein [Dysgonamonadaceae bacterium]|jgi:predicted nuclease of restriction endonuclease-like (RecB) superfamily|nr:PDDEXK nuclease domain-containing protein [Dysgonamonadaceae bacterium]
MEPAHNQYNDILRQIITEIKSTRVVVARRINTSIMQMYWNIGKRLSEEKLEQGYGSNVVKRLEVDLKHEFPDATGFSARNLWDMKKFYEYYSLADEKLRQLVAVLPWKHNLLIMSKTQSLEEARYYIEQTHENSWTRDVLLNFIKADTYNHAKVLPKQHNFFKALPEDMQQQADEILKSTYNLGFLGLTKPVKERKLENSIVEKIKLFLLELGNGFSFIGNQYRLISHSRKEYAVDLLFFNRKLHSLVAIDLKIGSFEPEFVGKMNFYLGLLDDQVKQTDENPSIGIILCADKDKVDVEIALRDINKPIGIADYQLYFPEKEIKALISEEMKNKFKR